MKQRLLATACALLVSTCLLSCSDGVVSSSALQPGVGSVATSGVPANSVPVPSDPKAGGDELANDTGDPAPGTADENDKWFSDEVGGSRH